MSEKRLAAAARKVAATGTIHSERILNKFAGRISLIGKYEGRRIETRYRCVEHGVFNRTPFDMDHQRHGCPKCLSLARTENNVERHDFAARYPKRLKEQFGARIKAGDGEVSQYKALTHICSKHGEFERTPDRVLRTQYPCPDCLRDVAGESRRMDLNVFLKQLKKMNERVQYVSGFKFATAPAKFRCVDCDGAWISANAHSVMTGATGCPVCKGWKHSAKSIQWLEQESRKRRIKIQHARNDGEFRIPGTRYRADGYHRRSNTVFEFYGDCYHGNLNRYTPRSKPNPFSDLTAKQLHRNTMEREALLTSLGYNVVSIWESDFDASR